MERRYDIDWVRVIAIALLIIYHLAVAFQPWGVLIGFIQNEASLNWLWVPMSMLNVWRIPLLFFVSGMGVWFAMRKRTWHQLILERARRILVPFLFGIVVIVPVHTLLFLLYYKQDLRYIPGQGHLWFLGNIFIYVVVLLPLFHYLKKREEGKIRRFLQRIFRTPLGMVIIALFFMAEAVIAQPETFETYARTFHGYLLGFVAFFFGFITTYAGNAFRNTAGRYRWVLLLLASSFFVFRFIYFNLQAPLVLTALESSCWIFTVFGFASVTLNRPGRVLDYLRQAAYPVYILHMIFMYLGSYILMPLPVAALLKFFLLVLFTLAGCLGTYELIRRTRYLRILFGLKGMLPFSKDPRSLSPSLSIKRMNP